MGRMGRMGVWGRRARMSEARVVIALFCLGMRTLMGDGAVISSRR